jgi:molecular chaperone GrpE
MIPGEPEEQKPESLEIESEQALSEARQKAENYLESWKRAQADFINYKRRAEQEKQEMGQYANAQLILSLLPVLDDFERAFDNAMPKEAKPEWVAGVKLIENKFRSILSAQGLIPIDAVGKPFDPSLHEAVMRGKGEEGIVVQEMRRGYKLNDRVLRPSQVVVGNGETDPLEENKT